MSTHAARGAAAALALAGGFALLPLVPAGAMSLATIAPRATTGGVSPVAGLTAATVTRPSTKAVASATAVRTVRVGRSTVRIPLHVTSRNWAALARCESGGRRTAVNPAGYYGLYQFNLRTWRGVGGDGYPHHASAAEQTARAQLLFMRRGISPWPVCGRRL